MKTRIILMMAAAAAMLLMLSGCGEKIIDCKAEDYVGIRVEGFDGEGKASVSYNRSKFYDKLNRELFDGEASEEQLAGLEFGYYNYVKINVEGETENLSNGDTFTVSVTADNDKLKECRIRFTDEKYTYTVSGLEEVKEIDLFEGVSIETEGISPYVNVDVVNNGPYADSDRVSFSVAAHGGWYANGDTAVVKAYVYDTAYFEENNLKPIATEKEFTVEVPEYYAAEIEHDFSPVDDFLKEKMDSLMTPGSTYAEGWENDGRAFFRDGEFSDSWKVISCEYTPARKALVSVSGRSVGISRKDIYNDYNIIWKLSLEIENTKKASYSSDYKYSVGDRETSEIYACTHIPNIVVEADGSLTFDPESCEVITYSTSLFGNYVGSTLEEIEEERKSDFLGYEHEYLVIS